MRSDPHDRRSPAACIGLTVKGVKANGLKLTDSPRGYPIEPSPKVEYDTVTFPLIGQCSVVLRAVKGGQPVLPSRVKDDWVPFRAVGPELEFASGVVPEGANN